MKRPLSITIISWYLIITSALALSMLPLTLNSPITDKMYQDSEVIKSLSIPLAIAGPIMSLVAGISMLRRKNWGRTLYLIGTFLLTAFTLLALNQAFNAIIGIGAVFYFIIAYFLLRKDASDYFHGVANIAIDSTIDSEKNPPKMPSQTTTPARRVGSVILLIAGGFFFSTWIMTIGIAAENVSVLVILSAIFLFMVSVFVVIGLWLWGWNRWVIVLGSFLGGTGSFAILTGFMFLSFASPDMQYLFEGQTFDPAQFESMGSSTLTNGLIVLVIGASLFALQKYRDNLGSPK